MHFDKYNFKNRADMNKINRIEKMLARPISIPGEYLLSDKVNDSDKNFWQFLNLLSCTHGTSWWKQENMMKITNISESKMKNNIRKLRSAGWLEVTKRFQSNKYQLIWPRTCENPRITAEKRNSKKEGLPTKQTNWKNQTGYRKKNQSGMQKAFP